MDNTKIVFFSVDHDGVKTIKEIPRDASLNDLLYEFGAFLQSAGFYFDGSVGIIERPKPMTYDQWPAASEADHE